VVTPTWSVLFDGECAELQVLMSLQLADALLMQVLFGLHPSSVHVTHALQGGPCREHSPLVTRSYVDVPSSY
jgi:hypothetical protein